MSGWQWVIVAAIAGLVLVVLMLWRASVQDKVLVHEAMFAKMQMDAWEKTLVLPPRNIMQASQVQPVPDLMVLRRSRQHNGGRGWRRAPVPEPVMYESSETRTETRTRREHADEAAVGEAWHLIRTVDVMPQPPGGKSNPKATPWPNQTPDWRERAQAFLDTHKVSGEEADDRIQ